MANLNEVSTFEAGIYQLETSDPVLGGPGGVSNLQPQQLANRTKYLKDRVDALEAAAPGYATIAYVQAELEKLDHKQSVRVASTGNLTLSGTQTIDGVVTSSGERILVKNQTIGSQNGIYVISASGWSRATDANDSAEVTPGLIVGVEEGTLNGDTRWQLTTNAPIVLATTALVFTNITAGFAPVASPTFTGDPTAPTPTSGDNDTSIATTAFVFNAIDGLATVSVAGAVDVTLTAAQAGTGIIKLTGVISANINVIFPTVTGQWIVENATSGDFNITAKLAAGDGVVLPQGFAVVIYSDTNDIEFASSASQVALVPHQYNPAAGTTTLTILGGYVAGNVIVEKNGGFLHPDEYTATNGSTVVLDVASVTDDVFTVYAFKSFEVADAIQRSGDTMGGPLLLAGDPSVALQAATKQYVDGLTQDASETVKGVAEIATSAEAQAFTANKLIDGAKLSTAFKGSNQSLSASGYQKLPGGLIIQWGTFTTTAGAKSNLTFPVAFPTALVSIAANLNISTLLSGVFPNFDYAAATLSLIPTWTTNDSSTTVIAVNIRWIAIGY